MSQRLLTQGPITATLSYWPYIQRVLKLNTVMLQIQVLQRKLFNKMSDENTQAASTEAPKPEETKPSETAKA